MPPRDTHTTDDSPWIGATRGGEPVTGRRGVCGWTAVTESYATMIRRYQDHRRETHPEAWLRA